MYCAKCGNEVQSENRFCPTCGESIASDISVLQHNLPSSNTVVEHLKITKALETRIYELEQMINNLHYKINKLKIVPDVAKPEFFRLLDFISPTAIIICLATAIIICLVCYFLSIFLSGLIFLCIITYIVGVSIYSIVHNSKEKKKYDAAIAARDKQCKINNRKIAVLKKEIEALTKTKTETEGYLKRVYSADIIFPKYRNMVAVTTMYEYFVSGRCSELKGHEGAYNIYESELRQNIIISSLNNIMQRLEQIKQNQYLLYEAIRQTQSMISDMSYAFDALSSNVNSIEANSKISAYNSRIAAENSDFIAYMNMMNL